MTSVKAIQPPVSSEPEKKVARINVSIEPTTRQVIVFAICLFLDIFGFPVS
jgi:hypothetical protein